MIGTRIQVFDIQKIRTIQSCNGAVVLTFGSGLVARFPPDHPDLDKMLREAEDNLQQGRPVGVLVNAMGQILELSHAHDTCVDSVRDDEEDEGRLPVWCWEFSPVCYLTRDHPEFDRIRATLEQAAASGSRVWLANRMHPVEGETEIWWKILDVRPIASVPQRNEAGRGGLP
jgi:hypothetical protein